METEKSLRLTFKNADNKKVNLNLPDAAEGLDAQTIQTAMQTIVDANIFARDGVDTYAQVYGASYIERTTKPVFELTEDHLAE